MGPRRHRPLAERQRADHRHHPRTGLRPRQPAADELSADGGGASAPGSRNEPETGFKIVARMQRSEIRVVSRGRLDLATDAAAS